MCGIAGFVGEGNQEVLGTMVESLKHRGPDDQGVFLKQGIGLGHTRLAIVDLSLLGHQPMFDQDQTIGVVFNGEIYNFMDLRSDLIHKGYVFKSHSDTEVIINLYKQFGEECFKKMNGMFAIALYDFTKQKLILARDRLGKKPLYWSTIHNTVIFGSELKALLCHPLCKKDLDVISLNRYFLNDYVATPRSIYKNIHKLDPGTILTFTNNQISFKQFWTLASTVSPFTGQFDEALNQLDNLLDDSVKIRLETSDVPVGVFLSGGLDSSTIAYYAKKYKTDLKTFSIGFSDKSFDESNYAKVVSDFLETDHHNYLFNSSDVAEILTQLPLIFDEPVADPSVIPTYVLAKLTRSQVTVALSGDGGDELFAGYPTFQADHFLSYTPELPELFRRLLLSLISNLPDSEKNFSLKFKLDKLVAGYDSNLVKRHLNWLGSFNTPDRQSLFSDEIYQEIRSDREFEQGEEFFNQLHQAGLDTNNALLGLYLKTYLQDQVLVKTDRASMAWALETRSPLLDYRLVEFAFSLPFDYKLHGFKTKYLLKKLMTNRLPDQIINRPKKGFGIPLAHWLRHDLKDFCATILSESSLKNSGLYNHQYINRLKIEHWSGTHDHHKKLWSLIMFELWRSHWLT